MISFKYKNVQLPSDKKKQRLSIYPHLKSK